MAAGLVAVARQAGVAAPQAPGSVVPTGPFVLGDIYDDEIERLTRAVYQRDYVTFGFADWAS